MNRIKNFGIWLYHTRWRYLILFPIFVLYLYAYFAIFCGVSRLPSDYTAYRDETTAKWALAYLLVQYFLGLAVLIVALAKHKANARLVVDVFLFWAINSMVYYGFSLTVCTSRYDFRNDWWVGQKGSHWAIVLDIFSTGKIPDPPLTSSGTYDLDNQYYQSKLWHLIAAYFIRFNYQIFHASEDSIAYYANRGYPEFTYHVELAFESLKILQAAIGYWLYVLSSEIFRHLHLTKRAATIGTILTCLLPFYAYIPFVYNNDALMIAFVLGALLMALRYFDRPSFLRAALCALLLGLAMMSKINAGLAAFPIAFLFIISFIKVLKSPKESRKKAVGTFLGEMGVFALIVFPLGLFHSFYAWARYGESFDYVLYPGTEYSNNYLNVDFYGVYNRFIGLFTSDLFVRPYKYDFGRGAGGFDSYGYIDFNIWTGLFKTSLFGNAVYSDSSLVSLLPFSLINKHVKLIFNLWLLIDFWAGLSWIYWLGVLIRHKGRGVTFTQGFLVVMGAVTLGYYVYFCIKFPFTSTMHFRYASLLIFPLFASLGSALDQGVTYLQSNSHASTEPVHAFTRTCSC
jgi:hypothetical protein